MLKRLHIRNYALIDQLEIDFSDRLTIITGETGAGKSILLGALGLVMGERADTKVFYNDGEKCIVEAFFDVSRYDVQDFFEENELDYETEVVIRRELAPNGKSRAFINDTPVNNQILQRLTESLIDLHQQFDTLDIHNVSFQLRMIDALADNQTLLKTYQEKFKQYSTNKRRLSELTEQRDKGLQEMDFFRFQWEELDKAALITGEQEQLESELARLSNAEAIKQSFGGAFNYLSETEHSIISQVLEIARSVQPLRRLSTELGGINDRIEGVLIDLQEIAKDCDRIAEQTEYDPQRIAEVQERLNTIYKLQKKHSLNSIAELQTLHQELEQRLGNWSNLDEQIAQVEQALQAQEQDLHQQAAELSVRRQAVIAPFEKNVESMLAQLSMAHARLKVDVQQSKQLNATGADDVQFLFASNVGSRFLPIKDVASGGELSRLTLCTKSLVADAIPLPTLIFDEIDSGVSGDVSMKMGLILKELSSRHQVISITHTPQVAARAHKHYFVYKKVSDNRTATNLRLLSDEERIRSIAVMLSGNPPSDAAMTTASELVQLN